MYPEFCNLTKDQALEYFRYTEFIPLRIAVEDKVKQQNGTILDVGCGNGIDAQWYYPDQYLGVDISVPLIWAAKKLNPLHRFAIIPLGCLPFKDKSWDTVFSHAVLDHQHTFEAAKMLFNEMVRVAKCRVIIGWHQPPWDKPTEIRKKQYDSRHFNLTGYGNRYNRDDLLSDFVGSMKREPFTKTSEIWVITKNDVFKK